MNAADNPFAPGAGTQPPELTGRSRNLEDAEVALSRIKKGMAGRSSLLIGLRGVGKTVLLNRIQQISREMDYLSAPVEAPEGTSLANLLAPHLRQILLQLDLVEGAKSKARKALGVLQSFASTFNIKIGDVSIAVNPPGLADSGNLENDLIDLLVASGEAAQAAGVAVAIFIDELQYVEQKELAALIAGLHRVGQLNLPLVLFGAGLPQLAGLTGKAKTYAERLFAFQKIDALSEQDAKSAIREPIERSGATVDEDALSEIVRSTAGYPYFLQEWGLHAWNHASGNRITLEDVHSAEKSAIEALDQSFFRVRFDRLTKSEKEYLRAMAELGPGPHRSGDIAGVLKRAVDSVAPIRANAIAKGMIYSPSYGDNAFTVPKFDEYMKRVIPEFTPTPVKKRVP